MEAQKLMSQAGPCLKATLHLGSETYDIKADKAVLSEQLASMKEQSMIILKEFITKHEDPDEITSDDEYDAPSELKR